MRTVEEAAWLAVPDQVDAADAADLVRIRKKLKLKLKQVQAAQLAGGGKTLFPRCERGQAKPVTAATRADVLAAAHI